MEGSRVEEEKSFCFEYSWGLSYWYEHVCIPRGSLMRNVTFSLVEENSASVAIVDKRSRLSRSF